MPAANYHFVNWSDSSTANPRTDTGVTATQSVTANFAIDTYTLAYTAGANGTLTGTTPQTVNHGASGTAVTAVAAANYNFVNWSDGSTANPRTDNNVTAAKSVTANFAINTYTLTYTAGANGSLTGTTPQTINHGSSGSAVTAVPATSYRFVNWSDGVLTATRTDTNVTASRSFTANFELTAPTPNLPTVTLTGLATVTMGVNTAYTESGAFSGPSALAAGGYHSLAVRSDGTVAAWGSQTTIPAGLSSVVALAAGGEHSLALISDGTVAGWGRNLEGQTTLPASLSNAVAIAAGEYHSLALRSDGTVAAWGQNTYGQTDIPAGLDNVVAIAAGGYHNLALRSDGTVVAWGWNFEGQASLPAGLSNVVAIAAGFRHSLALRSDGTVAAWGDNTIGQTTIPSNVYLPATVSGSVDTHTPGNYVLTYSATNFLGGSSSTTRTVVVVAPFTLTYTAGVNGTITGSTPQTVDYGANGNTVTAVPATGYHFVNWSDGSTSNPRIDVVVTANRSVTANFAIGGY